MTDILIHDGKYEDWKGLLSLLQASFAYMECRIDPPSSLHRLTVETIQEKAEAETLLLAYEGKKLVGCCFLEDRGDRMYLGKLAVSPELQKHGIGADLVRFALDYSHRQGARLLELQSRIELTEVHAFFRRFGFRQSGTTAHAGYDRPTSLTMQLDLGKADAGYRINGKA